MSEPLFNSGDRQSPTWMKLSAYLTKELSSARQLNDDSGKVLSENQTARIRGKIALLKELIALGNEPEQK